MAKTYTDGSTRLGLLTRAVLFAMLAFVGFANSAFATCTINGGAIGSNQSGCAPFDPAPLTNVTSVSSPYGGPFAYVWLVTTDAGAVAGNNQNWTVLNVNAATYDPGPISVTTWYRRCARRAVSICPDYDGESNWVKITVNPTPTANITGNLAITAGQSTTLTATGGGTYAWNTGATSAAITVSPATTTSYTVTVTGTGGCTATKTVTVTVTPAGPNCDVINISAGQGVINISGLTAPVVMVQIYNSSWTSVFNQTYSNQPGSINIPNLPTGQYFVKVDFLTASWQAICAKDGFFTVTGAPNPCSITANISNKVCNNNGTPNNPNDDTYSFTLTVNGTNTSGTWQGGYSNAYLGAFQFGPTAYGTPINLGPFPAANFTPSNVQPPITLPNGVDISINVADSQNSSCSASTVVTSTGGCSNGGGGTPDCTAITITASAGSITATGLTAPVVMLQVFNAQWTQVFSQTYTNSPGTVTVPNLAGGTYFVKASLLNASWALVCAKEAFVTVGGGGGNPCSITAVIGAKICNDNGTPNNPNDDTFTFKMTVNKTGDCAASGWHGPIGNQNFSGLYGVETTIGPFPIATNPSVDIWVMDNVDMNAQFDITIQAPAPCSGGGGGTPDCNAITTTGSNGSITVGNLTAPITMLQVFNSAWGVVFNQTYTSAPGTVTIPNLPAGQYFVKVNFLTAGWTSICAKEVYVTVTGGGGNTPTLTINDVTVNENAGTATLQICASATSTSPMTVVYSTTPNTALAGSDYTTTSATATIPAGQTCVNITIPIVDDNVNEPTEVFHVYLTNPNGATIADNEGLVTILDNDSAPGGNCDNIQITAANGTISITGLTAPIVMVQAFNAAWAPVFNQTYTAPPGSVNIPSLPAGQYFVKVSFLSATWQSICNKEVFITVPGGNTGVLSLTCPIDMTATAAQGATSSIVNYNSPSASTTCAGGVVNLTRISGPASGSAFPIGTTQVCFKATDNCGNEKTCCFNVTVNPPVPTNLTLTCTNNITVTANPGANSTVVNYTGPTANTTCAGGAVNLVRTSGPASGSAFPIGTTQVCYTASDNCGNTKSCCFTVTVNDGGPVCTTTRTVSNSKENCGAGTSYGLWINVAYPGTTCKTFSLSGASFVENADGTAKLTGVATNTCNSNIKFNVDIDFCGRTFNAPSGSPKTTSCYNANANGWAYYTTMCGTLTGTNSAAGAVIKITRRGEAFQVGTGANLNENVFGASGWFNLYVTSQPTSGGSITANDGDININLSGSATASACGNGSANCSSVACYAPPTFPDPTKCYKIVNKASGKVLDADYHPDLVQWAADQTSSQRWKFENAGTAGYWNIESQSSNLAGQNKVIGVSNSSTSEDADVNLMTQGTGQNMQFSLQDAGNGYYYIVARHSGKAIKTSANPGTNGTSIIQRTISSSNEHQKWQIVAIDCNNGLVSLPSEQLVFNANRSGNSVDLNWLSNTGDRNDYFVIEHSTDNQTWTPLQKVNGQGAAKQMLYFNESDNAPAKGVNYYRLAQIFRDGTVAFSNVQQVLMPTSKAFAVFPNPTSGEVFADLSEFEGQRVAIRLVDAMGKSARIVEIPQATAQATRLDLQGFDNGVYQVEMVSNGVRRVSKLVVSNRD